MTDLSDDFKIYHFTIMNQFESEEDVEVEQETLICMSLGLCS